MPPRRSSRMAPCWVPRPRGLSYDPPSSWLSRIACSLPHAAARGVRRVVRPSWDRGRIRVPTMPLGLLFVWLLGLLSLLLTGGGVYLLWAWYAGLVVGTGYLVAGLAMLVL